MGEEKKSIEVTERGMRTRISLGSSGFASFLKPLTLVERHMLMKTFSFVSRVLVLTTKPGSGMICMPLGPSLLPPRPFKPPPESLGPERERVARRGGRKRRAKGQGEQRQGAARQRFKPGEVGDLHIRLPGLGTHPSTAAAPGKVPSFGKPMASSWSPYWV